MTEIGMALSNPYQGERRPGSVGSPLPGVEARIAEDGEASDLGDLAWHLHVADIPMHNAPLVSQATLHIGAHASCHVSNCSNAVPSCLYGLLAQAGRHWLTCYKITIHASPPPSLPPCLQVSSSSGGPLCSRSTGGGRGRLRRHSLRMASFAQETQHRVTRCRMPANPAAAEVMVAPEANPMLPPTASWVAPVWTSSSVPGTRSPHCR
jgi:hypothetical protein